MSYALLSSTAQGGPLRGPPRPRARKLRIAFPMTTFGRRHKPVDGAWFVHSAGRLPGRAGSRFGGTNHEAAPPGAGTPDRA
jgi:hypothetical protein